VNDEICRYRGVIGRFNGSDHGGIGSQGYPPSINPTLASSRPRSGYSSIVHVSRHQQKRACAKRHETARSNSISGSSFKYEILAKKDCQLQTCPRKRDHQPQFGCLPVGYSGRFARGAALRWFLRRRFDWRSLGFSQICFRMSAAIAVFSLGANRE